MKTIKVSKATVSAATEAAVVAENVKASSSTPAKARAFTYIGQGEGSPHVINFMGKQKFVRGQLTEVTDGELLAKLPGVATFIEGPVEVESLHNMDADAKEKADKKRSEDVIINANFSKKFRQE